MRNQYIEDSESRTLLGFVSRDTLRRFAVDHNIRRGKSKEDMISNIMESDVRCEFVLKLRELK